METTIKFIFNVFQLIVICKIALFVTKIFTGRFRLRSKRTNSRSRKYSIVYKLYILGISPIIYKLDDLIYQQKQKRLEALRERQVPVNNDKVINIKNIKNLKNVK